jgi:hypothetical protein
LEIETDELGELFDVEIIDQIVKLELIDHPQEEEDDDFEIIETKSTSNFQ